jgi:hypothetical protein
MSSKPDNQIAIYGHATKALSQVGFPRHSEHIDADVFTCYEYLESRPWPLNQDRLNVVVFNAMRGTHLDEILARIENTPALRVARKRAALFYSPLRASLYSSW